MAINIILVIIGLIICFGGIYIKKICGFTLGFTWGAFTTFLVELAIIGFSIFSFLEIEEEELIIVLIGGIVFGILSAIYDKICVAISTFLSIFSLSTLLMLLFNLMEGIYMYIIASVISFVFSFIATKIYNYSYIFISAFTGAFVASIGGYGLYREIEFYSTIKKLIVNEESRNIILISTLVVGVIGFIFQLYRLNVIKKKKNKPESASIEQQTVKNTESHKKEVKVSFNYQKFFSYVKKPLCILISNWHFILISLFYVISNLLSSFYFLNYIALCLAISATIFIAFNRKGKFIFSWLIPTIIIIVKEIIEMTTYPTGSILYLKNVFNILISPGLIYFSVLIVFFSLKFFGKNVIEKKKAKVVICSIYLCFSFFYSYTIGYIEKITIYGSDNIYDISPLSAFVQCLIATIFFYILQSNNDKNVYSITFVFSLKQQLKSFIASITVFAMIFITCGIIHSLKPVFVSIKSNIVSNSEYECYNQKIADYIEEMSIGFDEYSSKDFQSNYNLIADYYNFQGDVAYSIYDIDSNGVPELLFGNLKNIVEIYTMDNSMCVNYFPNETFGYRYNVMVLKDGHIFTHGFGGAYHGTCTLYKINPDGLTLSIEEAYYFNNIERDAYYEETHEYVSLEEYNSINQKMKGLDIYDSLEWKLIS